MWGVGCSGHSIQVPAESDALVRAHYRGILHRPRVHGTSLSEAIIAFGAIDIF
jgi:hypothetical protein